MNDNTYIYFTLSIIMFILVVFTTKTMSQESDVIKTKTMASGLDGIQYKGLGVRGGISSDPDQGYLGAHVNMGEFIKDVRFRPSTELGFGDDQIVWQILAEVHYVFPNIQNWQPYAGGGLGLTYVNYDDNQNRNDDSDTDFSFNPMIGIETAIDESRKFFFEIKLGLTNNDPDIKFGVGVSWDNFLFYL